MKTTTYYVLKPEEAETIYITLDQQTAFDLGENSTLHLSLGAIELNEEAKEIIDLFLEEWIDLSQWKFPYKKTDHGYEYDSLTPDEFLGLLMGHPSAARKLLALEDWKDFPIVIADLEREVYEIFQKFPLKEDK
ncbi:TPA: hypothetical protein NKQ35_000620 [Vibrio parahaemolyticus]|nr:hypothetical protein [Vibrio parahaemolyticus]HCH1528229.1 hypothetical protein [Vibrio parahaemolyticus]